MGGASRFAKIRLMGYSRSMEKTSNSSGAENSGTASTALPTSKPDTYVVLNPLPPSRIEWLKQQSLHVAEVFRQSMSERAHPEPH